MGSVFVDFSSRWETFHEPESKKWFGVCPELRLHASGETHSDLLRCIEDVLHLLVADLIEEDDFEEFMKARGVDTSRTHIPTKAPKKFDIPFEIARQHPAPPNELLAVEIGFLLDNIDALRAKYPNCYLLIKGKRVHGAFEAYDEAVDAGIERFKRGPFLVRSVDDPDPDPLVLPNFSAGVPLTVRAGHSRRLSARRG